jgi:antitoxin ParD1/3/4
MSKSSKGKEALVTINLKPEQQRVLDLAVLSGAYQNAGEVLDQAFEIIREQLQLEDWMLEQRDAAAAHIETGFAQAERGELIDGDTAIEMLGQRRAQRLEQGPIHGGPPAKDMVELFAPLRGLNLTFERDRDPGRDIEL